MPASILNHSGVFFTACLCTDHLGSRVCRIIIDESPLFNNGLMCTTGLTTSESSCLLRGRHNVAEGEIWHEKTTTECSEYIRKILVHDSKGS